MFDDLIGKPYKEHGRGLDGYDCYGVCMKVCERIGIKLPEVDELSSEPFYKPEKPQLGDIVLINAGVERHVGVMLDRLQLLTVYSTGRRGVHRMRIDHPWIKDRILGIYRYAR